MIHRTNIVTCPDTVSGRCRSVSLTLNVLTNVRGIAHG
jgi:hypothetical protein